ncbi:3-oxoacyl-[acyl-carrier-protein] synthase III C-terminal domain-containing protein [Amycolatopsis carbonis]|uniref:3-oxoacyl-[acyl-carrier-protein] synthase III C-terminal domain-containing protein n=1 Tax=Amycolatopsis carbonis TaxID=715471 RepID=A0A9Y2IDT3_9PSEU|nr:3-oxoacyl-[acyl-carrier-protein] synthase III C-terminal domain-containing protein [Amycolatopsis sp. 2-15]WIX76668.1 3-oxoacyl-[acyl-carrier-protein] synthase III C-terminal domain-containing protein [Amycolatopsis sp. 2-15]
MVIARLAGSGCAFPARLEQDVLWDEFFAPRLGHSRVAERLFRAAGVRHRHGVANPLEEDVSQWSTSQRMERFIADAPALGAEAVAAALADAGLDASEVGMFAVASCTGYSTPGLDIRVASALGMPDDVQRLLIGHMGCYAALPGLGAVSDYVVARRRPAVLLCLELTSLHAQPATGDLSQVVTHALFADAAAAVVLRPTGPGPGVVDIAARTDSATAGHMRWEVTDQGFRMGLSPEVPAVLGRHVGPVVTRLLEEHDLAVSDIGAWAVHPGGPRILEIVEHRLELPPGALGVSHGVLRERGNCSSATVLVILDELLRGGQSKTGKPAVMMAFGPGLTLYTALLSRPD